MHLTARTRLHWSAGALAATFMLIALSGCDVYDTRLLRSSGPSAAGAPECGNGRIDEGELCDTAIDPGEPGGCPTECRGTDPCEPHVRVGIDCQVECLGVAIVEARNGDGCCPPAIGAGEDSDCGFCGDGIIGPSETCDPPENCVTEDECTRPNACLTGVFSGDSARCTARCQWVLIDACADDDQCCPDACDASNDNDCSASCGDGVVQMQAGETCEPEDVQAPCVATCDDGDACTSDLLTGSPSHCNARCTSEKITLPSPDDGCCPLGAHALNDNDCAPICGNAVTEPGEVCDGGNLCTPQCELTDEGRCLDVDSTSAPSACQACRCRECTQLMLGCFTDPDPSFATHCRDTIECGQTHHCIGDACYCGTNTACTAPNGPCRDVIDDAAQAEGETAQSCTDDPDCSVHQATAIGECVDAHCSSECGH